MPDYENKLNSEIEKRLTAMERDDYEFPERLNRRDYIIIGIVCAVCFVLVIIGNYI